MNPAPLTHSKPTDSNDKKLTREAQGPSFAHAKRRTADEVGFSVLLDRSSLLRRLCRPRTLSNVRLPQIQLHKQGSLRPTRNPQRRNPETTNNRSCVTRSTPIQAQVPGSSLRSSGAKGLFQSGTTGAERPILEASYGANSMRSLAKRSLPL
jgi:hypothetical protein